MSRGYGYNEEYYYNTYNRAQEVSRKIMATGAAKARPVVNKIGDYIEQKTVSALKQHFGKELFLYTPLLSDDQYKKILDWIRSIDKNFDKHSEKRFKSYNELCNGEYLLKIHNNTYVFIRYGRSCENMYTMNENLISGYNGNSKPFNMYMYFFGKKSFAYYKYINDIIFKVEKGSRILYKVTADTNYDRDSFRSIASAMKNRQMETLFFNDGITKSITDHIEKYLNSEDIYLKRGLNHKTGILLYGDPGTGKSSLCNAIASKYGMDMILIDMTTFSKLDTNSLTDSINADDNKYVVVLEDIDCIFLNRESKDVDRDDKKIINKLLQFLDSNSSPSNVIFIATTNHVELLDSALQRSGRFDLKLEIGGINRHIATNMCKSFGLSNQVTEEILNGIESFPVNQSYLQELILNNLENKDIVDDEQPDESDNTAIIPIVTGVGRLPDNIIDAIMLDSVDKICEDNNLSKDIVYIDNANNEVLVGELKSFVIGTFKNEIKAIVAINNEDERCVECTEAKCMLKCVSEELYDADGYVKRYRLELFKIIRSEG